MGVTCLGATAHVLGTQAEECFVQAMSVNGRLGAPAFVALTSTAYGSFLVHRNCPGDVTRARALREARRRSAGSIESAERGGVELARALLRALHVERAVIVVDAQRGAEPADLADEEVG